MTPTTGQVAVLTATIGTGAALYTSPGINWKLNIDAKPKDISNFRDGRRRAATMTDCDLSLTLVWDKDDQPTKAANANIRDGLLGTVRCYTDATHFFVVPIIVATIGPENSGMEDVVMMDVGFQLNGTIIYPLDT